MPQDNKLPQTRIDQFFSGPGARADRWRDLVDAAKAWSDGVGDRAKFEAILSELAVTEEYHGYTGANLMTALRENASEGDARATLNLAERITRALMTRSFRQHAGDWDANQDSKDSPDQLLPSLSRSDSHRPYF